MESGFFLESEFILFTAKFLIPLKTAQIKK